MILADLNLNNLLLAVVLDSTEEEPLVDLASDYVPLKHRDLWLIEDFLRSIVLFDMHKEE